MRTRRRLGRMATLALLAGALPLVWACHTKAPFHEIGQSHRPALHAVHCKRLAVTMQGINHNFRKAYRFPIRQARARHFEMLAHCAEQIAGYAAVLPESIEQGGMTAESRAIFESLADRLKVNAEGLMEAANNKDGRGAAEAFAKLTSTCNSCHAAFRQPETASGHGES